MGSKSGLHFELILFGQNKVLPSVSLSYISNLDQIIRELEKRFQNLTEDEYGLLRLIREQDYN